jgi:hypothetical protein
VFKTDCDPSRFGNVNIRDDTFNHLIGVEFRWTSQENSIREEIGESRPECILKAIGVLFETILKREV